MHIVIKRSFSEDLPVSSGEPIGQESIVSIMKRQFKYFNNKVDQHQ